MTTNKKPKQYSVLVMDLFRYQDKDEERTIGGLPTFELAKEYARRFVRRQLEEARRGERAGKKTPRNGWWMYGEDAMVLGGLKEEKYSGSEELDFFIDLPATEEECDYDVVLRKALDEMTSRIIEDRSLISGKKT